MDHRASGQRRSRLGRRATQNSLLRCWRCWDCPMDHRASGQRRSRLVRRATLYLQLRRWCGWDCPMDHRASGQRRNRLGRRTPNTRNYAAGAVGIARWIIGHQDSGEAGWGGGHSTLATTPLVRLGLPDGSPGIRTAAKPAGAVGAIASNDITVLEVWF